MAFIDEIHMHVQAGKGGDGVVRWRQERAKPLMGPSGGNGGRGGNIVASAVRDLAYLERYKHTKDFKAENGQPGGNNSCEGKNGEDALLYLPMGSRIVNKDTGDVYELISDGQEIVIARGGKGGHGNEHFKSSRNTTPYESTPGQPGQDAELYIELQLIADIGLVGLPSAGKSTILNMMTNANSKVGAYDFTTLEPHLGVLPGNYVLADIPGLIEGAHTGKGLGFAFLRHIKRTRIVAHVISCEHEDPCVPYQTIRNELVTYDPDFFEAKSEMILLSKSDMCTPEELDARITQLQACVGIETPIYTLTNFDDDSIKQARDAMVQYVEALNMSIK